jgi:hypothetical protein
VNVRRFTRQLAVSSLALALVASACGRSGGSKSSTAGGAAPAGAAASGDFGTLKAVCGPGNAKGATDPGVTDTSINVATMADPGATVRPGLDQELFDSADAFVGFCNAAGGILGRKLVLHKRDSKLFEVAARMVDSCQAPDFMLVGNGEGLDATGVQQRLSCKLPEIAGFDVSAQAGSAPLSMDPLPVPDDESNIGGALRALKKVDPEAIKHYGLISSTVQSVKDSGNRDKAAAQELGYTLVNYQEMPASVDNWRPYVENLRSASVQVLGFQGDPTALANVYKTMKDVGYFPKYALMNANNYDPTLTSLAGAALQGQNLYVSMDTVPFELANQYPATKQYVGLLQQYVNGAKPKALGINGISAWLLWAESAKACGSTLTRDCVLSHAMATTNWTGGGLHAAVKPGNATIGGSPCFLLVKATPTGFTIDKDITKPNNGIFNCDPANAFRLKGFPPS